jgi:hypothetical protein
MCFGVFPPAPGDAKACGMSRSEQEIAKYTGVRSVRYAPRWTTSRPAVGSPRHRRGSRRREMRSGAAESQRGEEGAPPPPGLSLLDLRCGEDRGRELPTAAGEDEWRWAGDRVPRPVGLGATLRPPSTGPCAINESTLPPPREPADDAPLLLLLRTTPLDLPSSASSPLGPLDPPAQGPQRAAVPCLAAPDPADRATGGGDDGLPPPLRVRGPPPHTAQSRGGAARPRRSPIRRRGRPPQGGTPPRGRSRRILAPT